MKRSIRERFGKLNMFFSQETPKKYIVVFGLFLALSVLCEIFIFNYKWLDSMSCKTIDVTPVVVGYENNGATSSSKSVIMYKKLNQPVKYLYFDPQTDNGKKVDITVSAIDDANANYLSAPTHAVVPGVEASKYIKLHFSDNIHSLKATIKGMKKDDIDPSSMRLNVHVPLLVSWERIIALFLILSVTYILRPKSSVYKYKTNLRHMRQKIVCAVLWVVLSVSYAGMSTWNSAALGWYENNVNHQQYYNVIDAMKSGHLSFADGSNTLNSLDNPYDYAERVNKRVVFKWDNAYYKGKYYSYFGIAPALILYLPYNLITGQNLPNTIALCIFGIASIFAIMLLLWEVIKKWYRDTPFAIYLLLCTVIPFASALAYAAYKPDFYMVPPMAGLMFAVFGLAAWISAEKVRSDGVVLLSPTKLALGSFCIAVTSACRPQFLITIVFGIILYRNHVFKTRTLFSKKSIRQTIALCLPFIIIGAAVMWYNYARFESPFDFGANYNLTSNDMTHRGFVPGRIGLGIFTYFFQPVKFDAVFPFIHDFACATSYQGLTLSEKLMGGAFMLYPLLAAGLYGMFSKHTFSGDKRAYQIVCASIIMALVVAVLDAQMAGLLTRYFTDYVWMMMIASSITIFAVYKKKSGDELNIRRTRAVVLALSYVTLAFALLSIPAHSENAIVNSNAYIYYKIQHLIAFWS